MRVALMKQAGPPSYALSSWLSLRLLGLCYLAAFWSFGTQVRGLIGSHGILPARDVMEAAGRSAAAGGLAISRWFDVPTIFWLGSSDAWLVGVCIAGALLSLLLVTGVMAPVTLPLLWFLYLSLTVVTREFLSFQWDSLLLEAGLLAIGLAPWVRFHTPRGSEPPALARWLFWWLAFRLMFAAGLVKLTSGEPLWRDLTALAYHYETQPLPTPAGWYAHHLPLIVHQASAVVTFVIELVVPWLIFAGVRGRRVAAASFGGLMAAIAVTGNYAFFNLLTVAVSVTLWDTPGPAPRPRPFAWAPAAALAVLTLPASVAVLAGQTGLPLPAAPLFTAWQRTLAPFRSVNPYGLFAVMSSARPELTIEGSLDGLAWRPYAFAYKPGDPRRAPRWVAPHQPRLDWHMWFAALDLYEASPWLERFCRRLLEGEPSVARLLAANPFPAGPPRFIRVTSARYRIPPLDVARREGIWWTVGPAEPFSPVLARR
ncbi:MAG: lipase maturation factor family protein [Vicinamibacterales bacterium]